MLRFAQHDNQHSAWQPTDIILHVTVGMYNRSGTRNLKEVYIDEIETLLVLRYSFAYTWWAADCAGYILRGGRCNGDCGITTCWT